MKTKLKTEIVNNIHIHFVDHLCSVISLNVYLNVRISIPISDIIMLYRSYYHHST